MAVHKQVTTSVLRNYNHSQENCVIEDAFQKDFNK